MKKINVFITAASIVALLSCSKTSVPSLKDDALIDEQTKSETSGGGGRMGVKISPRDVVTDSLTAIEVVKDEEKKDTIPSDSIQSDTIPFDSIPKDRIGKGSFVGR